MCCFVRASRPRYAGSGTLAQRARVFWLSLACLAAGMMIATPAAAQVGYQVGGLMSWLYGFDETRLGFQAGMHYDPHDRVQVGVLYVNKGRECCMTHSIEVPITYRHPIREIAYVVVGVAPGYDHHGEFSEPLEVSALLGLGAEMLRTDRRRIFLEVAFTHGLIGAQHDTSWEPRHYKTVRLGLNVRR